MNRRLLVIATTLVFLVVTSATAQEDNLLLRYDLAIENLEIAVDSVPADGVQARDELERALNALLTLSTNATSPSLVQAMERTFDRTREAIENQSTTDMAVQTAVLRGGFARLVMDSAFAAAAGGDIDLARARLDHLADDLGFDAEARAALQDGASTGALRLAFEAGAADAVAAKVAEAQELLATDRAAAYRSLATAYGESLLVQDSPRVSGEMNRQLVAAANALVNEDDAAAGEALTAAHTDLESLAATARGAEPGAPEAAPAEEAAPADLPTAPQTEAPADAGEAAPAAATEQAAEPPAAEGQAEAGATAAEPDPAAAEADALPLLAGPDFEAALQQRLNELEEERQAEALSRLSRQLTLAGIPAPVAEEDAAALLASGYDSLDGVLTELEAEATRAVSAQRSGDVAGAESAIREFRAAYQGALAPIMRSVDLESASATEGLLDSLLERASLTSHDVTLLAAQATALRSTLLGGPLPAGQELELQVDSFWSNLTRPVVFIVLALLAIVPLVLLNLAFGGSNRNWRLVGWSLFLLLLPLFYEGIASLAALIGRFVDQPWLASLASWSPFTSTVSQVAWAASVLIALLLAIIGLYGICVQFGLLGGGRRQRTTATSTAVAEPRPTGSTTIDWDEEF